MAWLTPLDKVFNQRVLFYAFVGIIVGTTAVTLFSDSRIGSNSLKGTVLDSESQGTNASLVVSRLYYGFLVNTLFSN